MIVVYSKNSVAIRITEERWSHISRRHPEIQDQKDKVEETVSNPDFIQKGDFFELLALRFYPKTPLTKKYLTVVYKELTNQDGFVLTAYFTNSPSERRRILWKR